MAEGLLTDTHTYLWKPDDGVPTTQVLKLLIFASRKL